MGTKNNPGKWDCYANAKPDEPMFVLLGRDPLASYLVNLWALARVQMDMQDADQAKEALDCAEAMMQYAKSLGKDCNPAEVALGQAFVRIITNEPAL